MTLVNLMIIAFILGYMLGFVCCLFLLYLIRREMEQVANEIASLGTSVNDRIKRLKNQNEISRLFKKEDEIRKMHERQNEELRNMKDDEIWQ